MRLSVILILSSGVVLVGIGYGVSYRFHAGAIPSTKRAHAVVSATEEIRSEPCGEVSQTEFAALRREVAILKTAMTELRSREPERANVDNAEPVAARLPREPAAVQERELERRAQMAEIEARFNDEPRDPKWSSVALSALREAFQGDETIRAAMGEIDCRARSCRVELSDDGSGTLSTNLPAVLHQVSGVLPTMQSDHTLDAAGHAKMVLYMARHEEGSTADVPGMERRQ
jgi:hypothetical protein